MIPAGIWCTACVVFTVGGDASVCESGHAMIPAGIW